MRDLKALAGFEKSGHFFFNAPVGRGYDDGFVTAIAVLDMLDRNPGKSMADLYRDLPKTWGSPTMSPHCADEIKYAVADSVVARFEAMRAKGEPLTGQKIRDVVTVNGVRVTVEDGTWGLVRASSNKPELVVVVESPASEASMRDMFKAVDARVAGEPGGRRLQPDHLSCASAKGARALTTRAWRFSMKRPDRRAAGVPRLRTPVPMSASANRNRRSRGAAGTSRQSRAAERVRG